MRALVIMPRPMRQILDGAKSWEIRRGRCLIRELIGLIESGSGTVVGVAELVDCIGPLARQIRIRNARKMGSRPPRIRLKNTKLGLASTAMNPRSLGTESPREYRSFRIDEQAMEEPISVIDPVGGQITLLEETGGERVVTGERFHSADYRPEPSKRADDSRWHCFLGTRRNRPIYLTSKSASNKVSQHQDVV